MLPQCLQARGLQGGVCEKARAHGSLLQVDAVCTEDAASALQRPLALQGPGSGQRHGCGLEPNLTRREQHIANSHRLAVRPDVGWCPVGEALHVHVLWRRRIGKRHVRNGFQQQRAVGWQARLHAHP